MFPVTKVRKDECDYKCEEFNDVFTKNARENLKNSEGMPIGCQAMSLPYREEVNVRLVTDIEKHLPKE